MLRVILVDDEPLARLGMRQLLEEHPSVAVVAEAPNARTAGELIRRERPDAIFLDIEMPGGTGFDLLNGLENPPPVVFVTAHSEHAVRAFDVEAVDYLLKPVHPRRLEAAIGRLEAIFGGHPAPPSYEKDDRICLRTPGRTVVTSLDGISMLQADGDFTRVYLAGESPLLICQSLSAYERQVPSPPFARLNRSLLVNMNRIARVEASSRDEAKLYLEGVPAPFAIGRRTHMRLRDQLAALQP